MSFEVMAGGIPREITSTRSGARGRPAERLG